MPLAERDSRIVDPAPSAWESGVRGHAFLPGWESALVIGGIFAIVVTAAAFLSRKVGLRRRLSWCFALGVGSWLSAPFAADSAAGGLLAAAGPLLIGGAVVAELLLRRHHHGFRSAG